MFCEFLIYEKWVFSGGVKMGSLGMVFGFMVFGSILANSSTQIDKSCGTVDRSYP